MDRIAIRQGLEKVARQLSGAVLPWAPLSATAAGHASGNAWSAEAAPLLGQEFPGLCQHYEHLNRVLAARPTVTSAANRKALLGSPLLQGLLARSDASMRGWSPTSLFVEKQDDTADYVLGGKPRLNLLDVKSYNLDSKARPPNIISSLKIAKACKHLLTEDCDDMPELWYLSVDWSWQVAGGQKRPLCREAHVRNLLQADPSRLYINFNAGGQIQVAMGVLDQGFAGTLEDWARSYLEHYVAAGQSYLSTMKRSRIDPFVLPVFP